MESKHNKAYKGQGQYNQTGYHERKVIDRKQAVSPVITLLIIALLWAIFYFVFHILGSL